MLGAGGASEAQLRATTRPVPSVSCFLRAQQSVQ